MANPVVPARGMRDILPADKEKRDRVLQIIRDTYRQHGFAEIETPAVEPLTRLLSNQGGENEKMIFEIMRRGLDPNEMVAVKDAADLGLRYDLTVPLTRFYATHVNQLPRVFRALQTGPVWRAERPQKGRYRQFTQCDIDILGDDSTVAEVDLLTTTLLAFQNLGMGSQVRLLLNDRRVLTDLLAACNIAEENFDASLIVLDKADKIGVAGVRKELLEKNLMSQQSADQLLELTARLQEQSSPTDAPLATGVIEVDEDTTISLRELPEIARAVLELLPEAQVVFDATLVRGMGYYTGPIFEIAHAERNFSVAGGGRYDHVVGKWLGRDVPACGFSIGFERILDLVDLPPVESVRTALLYKPGQDPVALFKLRATLPGDVTLVVPPRRRGAAFFDQLVEDGFTHWVDGTRDDGGELRELTGN